MSEPDARKTGLDLDLSRLPTPLAKVVGRLSAVGLDHGADSFLLASYVFEVHLKLVTLMGLSGLRDSAPEVHYAALYRLARADGIGDWASQLVRLGAHDRAAFLPPQLHPLLRWLTTSLSTRDDADFGSALSSAFSLLAEIGHDPGRPPERPRRTELFSRLVELRNKTKAHGALGPDFYSSSARTYWTAVSYLLASFPFQDWDWLFLRRRQNQSIHAVRVIGETARRIPDSEAENLSPLEDGLHLASVSPGPLLALGQLASTTYECHSFLFSNGGYNDVQASGEFVDYVTGRTSRIALQSLTTPPAAKPASETEGLEVLDVHSNLWGNIPPEPPNYVARPALESEVLARLRDQNHPIVTLHGYGGVGKTTLALHAAHTLAADTDPRYDCVLWLSARDTDLTIAGPRRVRRAVTDVRALSRAVSRLVPETQDSLEALAERLRSPGDGFKRGILFILDNFETLDDVRGVHEFLDAHTHSPNKVLITSRERAFKADFPIEVLGMEVEEAKKLLRRQASDLQIEGLLTTQVADQIYWSTQGHPYLMKILVGELARSGRFVPLSTVFSQHERIRDAILERTFNGLSDEGRRIFFAVSMWRSPTLEVALQAVLLPQGINVEAGIDHCRRLSLIQEQRLGDDSIAYVAPPVARVFAEKKLAGDPDRLVVHEDLGLLRRFAPIDPRAKQQISEDFVVDRFLRWCMSDGLHLEEKPKQALMRALESLSEQRPRAWLTLANFRKLAAFDEELISYALRRATEELANDVTAWEARAKFAYDTKNDALGIQCLVSAVEAAPQNLVLVSDVASKLCTYIDQHREIPRTRRGVYLASVRSIMESHVERLDATALSRLAWLFLLEERAEEARKYAALGLERDRSNHHCRNLLSRLDTART